MARTKTRGRATPGTELFRDEQRTEGGPRMHGREWHEHPEPKDFEPEVLAGEGAAPEVEHGGTGAGMGKLHGKTQASQGKARRKRTTPVGKGPKKKPGAAKTISKSGHRATRRA